MTTFLEIEKAERMIKLEREEGFKEGFRYCERVVSIRLQEGQATPHLMDFVLDSTKEELQRAIQRKEEFFNKPNLSVDDDLRRVRRNAFRDGYNQCIGATTNILGFIGLTPRGFIEKLLEKMEILIEQYCGGK